MDGDDDGRGERGRTDPARAWGERRPNGVETLASLGIVMEKNPTLLLAGDIHHYERSAEGKSLHVVAVRHRL